MNIIPTNLIAKLLRHKRLVLFGIIFVLIYAGIYYIFQQQNISKTEIQEMIEPYGVYGVIALLLMQIVFSLTPLPDGAMPLIAMIMYGPIGVFIVTIGMFIAAIIHYKIGKVVGKNFVVKHFPETEKYLNKLGNRHVTLRLVALRLFTFVSFDITSYIAGISNIDIKTFLFATLIGLIPTNLILILIGNGLFAKSINEIITTWILIIFIFMILIIFYKKSNIK